MTHSQRSGSHCSVCMFINMVRLALVTSVTCTSLLLPPVRFCVRIHMVCVHTHIHTHECTHAHTHTHTQTYPDNPGVYSAKVTPFFFDGSSNSFIVLH